MAVKHKVARLAPDQSFYIQEVISDTFHCAGFGVSFERVVRIATDEGKPDRLRVIIKLSMFKSDAVATVSTWANNQWTEVFKLHPDDIVSARKYNATGKRVNMQPFEDDFNSMVRVASAIIG